MNRHAPPSSRTSERDEGDEPKRNQEYVHTIQQGDDTRRLERTHFPFIGGCQPIEPLLFPGAKNFTYCKTKNREQEGFTEHWRGGEGGLGGERAGPEAPPQSRWRSPRPGCSWYRYRQSSHPVRSFHLQLTLLALPSLSLWSRLSSVLSTHSFPSCLCCERGVIPSDLSPHQKQQLGEALTKACGSNVNPVSSRELGGMLCK